MKSYIMPKFGVFKALILIIVLATASQTYGQSCYFDKISNVFDYQTKTLLKEENSPVTILKIDVINKTLRNIFNMVLSCFT